MDKPKGLRKTGLSSIFMAVLCDGLLDLPRQMIAYIARAAGQGLYLSLIGWPRNILSPRQSKML